MFDYMPAAKPLYLCNSMPKFTESIDKAHWRRISIIPFDAQISEAEKVVGLAETILDTEAKLVLDWFLLGAARLIRNGSFTQSATLEERKTKALSSSCPVRKWADDQQVRKSEKVREKSEVFEAFKSWVADVGIDTKRTFIPDRTEFYVILHNIFPDMKASRPRLVRKNGHKAQVPCVHLDWGDMDSVSVSDELVAHLAESANPVHVSVMDAINKIKNKQEA
jgi:phage/plasmid-associated DNA primase